MVSINQNFPCINHFHKESANSKLIAKKLHHSTVFLRCWTYSMDNLALTLHKGHSRIYKAIAKGTAYSFLNIHFCISLQMKRMIHQDKRLSCHTKSCTIHSMTLMLPSLWGNRQPCSHSCQYNCTLQAYMAGTLCYWFGNTLQGLSHKSLRPSTWRGRQRNRKEQSLSLALKVVAGSHLRKHRECHDTGLHHNS